MLLGLYITFLWYVMYLSFFVNKPSAWLEASRTQGLCVFLVGTNWGNAHRDQLSRISSRHSVSKDKMWHELALLSTNHRLYCSQTPNHEHRPVMSQYVLLCFAFFIQYVISILALICFTFIRFIAIDSFDFIYEYRATTFSAVSWITQWMFYLKQLSLCQ